MVKLSFDKDKLRKKYNINLSGGVKYSPLDNFLELKERFGVSEKLLLSIKKAGFTVPTPIQRQVIPCMLKGEDILGASPTGSGKTIAFVIPILAELKSHIESHLRCLVVSPTKELSQQIAGVFHSLAVNTNLQIRYVKYKSSIIRKEKLDISIITPLIAVKMINKQKIKLDKLDWLILDEADQLLTGDWVDQMDQILSACTSFSTKHALFSATLHDSARSLVESFIHNPTLVTIGQTGTSSSTVEQILTFVADENGKLFELRKLIKQGLKVPVLIFVQSKIRARSLFQSMRKESLKINAITSDLPTKIRAKLVKRFRNGDIWFLICTDLMARGMDFEHVKVVINYDLPQSTASYIHRCGRTGRAGSYGRSITFWTEDDSSFVRNIVNIINSSGGEVPEWMSKLKKMTRSHMKKLEKKPVKRNYIPKTK